MNSILPQISIIIVSYNEWDYLNLTLQSLQKAIGKIRAEVLLIDNSSTNKIKEQVINSFPFVRIIPNTSNLGFSKANNLGLKQAKANIALLLNPDVLLSEDSIEKTLRFYEKHPSAGGMGVKMLNGQGNYLKESKRGLTTPLTSMFKMLGLTATFPNSKFFAPYYHGHLDSNKNHCVDVLSGAFLAQSKLKSKHFTLLDERYFMYGEDIDLSYQLQQNTGKNHYQADNTIIHFKGKTTDTSPIIIKHFYNAMWLFYTKNLKTRYSKLTTLIVYNAILFGQQLAILKLNIKKRSQKKPTQPIKQIQVISTNQTTFESIKNQHLSPGQNILLNTNIPESVVAQEGMLFVFDLQSIPSKAIISFIDTHRDKLRYAFISHDNKHLYTNGHLPEHNDVISLS